MTNVVDIRSHAPHIAGEAICTACEHEWVAVAEEGATTLECPDCYRSFGLLKHPVEPDVKWQCNCGEMLFWFTPSGAMCRGCGIITTDWCEA